MHTAWGELAWGNAYMNLCAQRPINNNIVRTTLKPSSRLSQVAKITGGSPFDEL